MDEYERRDVQVLAVLPHPASWYEGLRDIRSPMLADPAAIVSATYGAALQHFANEKWTNRPAIFVIDRDGVIRFEYPAKANRPRPTSDYLLQVVDGLAEKRKLIEALKHRDAQLSRVAGLSLTPIGTEARAAFPTLVEALEKDDADVRAGAAAALCWIVPKAKTAVPLLLQALRDRDSRVRHLAVEALGEIGPDARPAVPAIIRLLTDEDARARGAARYALELIGPAAVVGLLEALKDRD